MSEIETFFDENPFFGSVLVVTGIIFLVGATWLGRAFTPENGAVLTPRNWQIMNARKAYTQELDGLVTGAYALNQVLHAGQPDPIQGQIVTDAVLGEIKEEGHPALYEHRTALANAAVAVRSWTQGAIPHEDAQRILNETMQLLQAAAID